MSTSANSPSTNNSDDENFSSISREPFAWVLIPLVIFVVVGLIATFFQLRRRRRRRQQGWPGTSRYMSSNGRVILVRARPGRRGTGLGATRPEEGLNELGEAPPPYDGKKEGSDDGTELGDLEAGVRPPDYPTQPGPAVTTESRRSIQV